MNSKKGIILAPSDLSGFSRGTVSPRRSTCYQVLSGSSSRELKLRLLQLRVLAFGLFQDGDVGVGILPEREEIFVGGERADAGGIDIRPLRGSLLQNAGTSHSKMC